MSRKPSRIDPRLMLWRYAVALAFLMLCVIGGHGLHIFIAEKGKLDAEGINASGYQRTLSQRIAFAAARYGETGQSEYREVLEQSVNQFETFHEWLMENAVPPGTALETHYFGRFGANLDQTSRQFVILSRALLDAPSQELKPPIALLIEEIALSVLLEDLDRAVVLKKEAAERRLVRLEVIQITTLALTILVVALEVLFVFYPAHRGMAGMITRLKFQAWNDALTGLPNRTHFLEHIEAIFETGPTQRDRVFAMALDLDGFKDVNDTLGHPVGDQVLVHVSGILRQVLADAAGVSNGMAARMGGDEFLICGWVAEGDAAEVARTLGEAVIAALDEPVPVTLGDDRKERCIVGVSIGFALGDGKDADLETFLANADIALYESKRRGKGVVTAFVPDMRAEAEMRHQRTQDIKVGLKNLQFVAHFQPQVNLRTGELYGVEALARWQHPTQGLIIPDGFLKFANDASMLDALDGQIIMNALEGYQRCQAAGANLGNLSINVSEVSLSDPDFCDLMVRIVDLYDMRPPEVTIEILEKVLVDGGNKTAFASIQRLLLAGFQISIDDFGVGQSSLSRVSNLNVSSIKIDRSLTVQARHQGMQKILTATSAMAQGFGATLMAEGIETQDQATDMLALGVDIGQGELWSGALPIEDLEVWIAATYGAEKSA